MMKKRLAPPILVLCLILFLALLLPMVTKGNRPRVMPVTQVGQADSGFINQLAPHAQRLGKAYGVRPSVLLALASLETDYGRSLLGSKYHNLYGQAFHQGQGITVLIVGSDKGTASPKTYQVYASWEASLADYLVRVKAGQVGDAKFYEQLATAKTLEQAVDVLVTAQSGDSKIKAEQILTLIREQKLDQYDK